MGFATHRHLREFWKGSARLQIKKQVPHIVRVLGGASRVTSNSRGVVSHANDSEEGQEGQESEEGQEDEAPEGEEIAD